MKKYFSSIKNFFHSGKKVQKKDLFSPRHDWKYILVFFFVAIACSILIHWVIYIQAELGVWLNKEATPVKMNMSIQHSDLNEVVEIFEAKESHFDFIKKNPTTVSDPSL